MSWCFVTLERSQRSVVRNALRLWISEPTIRKLRSRVWRPITDGLSKLSISLLIIKSLIYWMILLEWHWYWWCRSGRFSLQVCWRQIAAPLIWVRIDLLKLKSRLKGRCHWKWPLFLVVSIVQNSFRTNFSKGQNLPKVRFCQRSTL